MLEIATAFANVSVQTRLVSKKDIKKYGRPDHQATTHDIIVRYQEREKQLLQSGTWDMQWGLRWLLSFIVLIETPVLCIINAKAMLSVVSKWICALKEAHIQEVEEQFSELEQITCVASDELVASLSVSEKLPGGFNAACSLVFAGDLKEAFVDLYMPKWALADHGATTESRYAAAQNTANSGLSLAAARGCVIQVFDSEDLSQVVCTHSIACDLRVSEIAGSGNGECDKDGKVFQPDIESLFVDHVKNADVVTDINCVDVSARMLSKAKSAVFESERIQAVFIECNSRKAFLDLAANGESDTMTQRHSMSINAPAAGNGHADALDRIAIKLTPTTEMFCALLATWHYCNGATHRRKDMKSKYDEDDFILWHSHDMESAEGTRERTETLPDYIFIDGIDRVASTDR
ncbi:hypothetical protein IWW48_002633 [Coemansia sp. RSA 1200]|nr:hypothetical protein IWW48_002633 [Coemansia sp. RSA 1200]